MNIRDGTVKTRKDHKCHGCLKIIPKGSLVYTQTNAFDGIYTLYMCNECKDYCKNKNCKDCYELEDAGPGYIKECKEESQ